MATTVERPGAGDALGAIEPLFSRVSPALPPVQFTGTAGARYNMGAGQPDPATLPRRVLTDLVADLLASDEGQAALRYGDASGYIGLRQAIADTLRRWERLEVDPGRIVEVRDGVDQLRRRPGAAQVA